MIKVGLAACQTLLLSHYLEVGAGDTLQEKLGFTEDAQNQGAKIGEPGEHLAHGFHRPSQQGPCMLLGHCHLSTVQVSALALAILIAVKHRSVRCG